MSAGVPVVSYDCPSGPRELVEHDVSGLLVGAGAKAGLAAALHAVASDPSLLTRLGEGAFEASRRYDADTIASEWESLFAQVVRDERTPDTPSGGVRSSRTTEFSREGVPVKVPAITPLEARGGTATGGRGGWQRRRGVVRHPHPRPPGADRRRARPSSSRGPRRARRGARPLLVARPRRSRLARTPPAGT
ncbi:glycosyltransferase [Nocardioides sp. B-3]|uniref:glycosyltransferase n=1 Tax=Nocardioides sp. B-3 TaxID=2895565 RepID=UPI003FA6112D